MRPKKLMVAKKKAASSPTPVLTSPDPAPDASRSIDTARPMDAARSSIDITSTPTPTTLPSYVSSNSMKKIGLASKYSKY